MIIVAVQALTYDVAVVKSGTSPGLVGVTIIASITADNMFRMLAGRAAVVMAQYAFKWCTLEHSANMACRAVYKLVLSC